MRNVQWNLHIGGSTVALSDSMKQSLFMGIIKPCSPLYKVASMRICERFRPNILPAKTPKAAPLADWPLEDRPRYLMGVGTPQNILEAIERGVDMFDCVMPTRNGRNGLLFTAEGTINIKNKKWESCFEPIDPDSNAEADRVYTLAYLHHLIRAEEILGLQICSIHNLTFYLWLVREARRHILDGDYAYWKSSMLDKLGRRL